MKDMAIRNTSSTNINLPIPHWMISRCALDILHDVLSSKEHMVSACSTDSAYQRSIHSISGVIASDLLNKYDLEDSVYDSLVASVVLLNELKYKDKENEVNRLKKLAFRIDDRCNR